MLISFLNPAWIYFWLEICLSLGFTIAICVKFMLILLGLQLHFMRNLILIYNGNLCKIYVDFVLVVMAIYVKFMLILLWNLFYLLEIVLNLTLKIWLRGGKLNICVFKLQINQTRGQSNIRQNQPKQSKFKPIITKSIAKSSKKAVHRSKFGPG